jgi:protocatechuate 3,4-dioxygenase alpha subunit/protocatechuate 3,4-dioxygenase beta subunit
LLQPLDSEDQARLIARHGGRTVDGAEVYQLDIIMAGANETPFFDDFES